MANQELQREMALAKVSIIQRVTKKSRNITLAAPPVLDNAVSQDIQELETLMLKASYQSSIRKRLSKIALLGRLFR